MPEGDVDGDGDGGQNPVGGQGLTPSEDPCTNCGSELQVMLFGGVAMCQCCIARGTCWRTDTGAPSKWLAARRDVQRKETGRVEGQSRDRKSRAVAAKAERARVKAGRSTEKQIDRARLIERQRPGRDRDGRPGAGQSDGETG